MQLCHFRARRPSNYMSLNRNPDSSSVKGALKSLWTAEKLRASLASGGGGRGCKECGFVPHLFPLLLSPASGRGLGAHPDAHLGGQFWPARL